MIFRIDFKRQRATGEGRGGRLGPLGPHLLTSVPHYFTSPLLPTLTGTFLPSLDAISLRHTYANPTIGTSWFFSTNRLQRITHLWPVCSALVSLGLCKISNCRRLHRAREPRRLPASTSQTPIILIHPGHTRSRTIAAYRSRPRLSFLFSSFRLTFIHVISTVDHAVALNRPSSNLFEQFGSTRTTSYPTTLFFQRPASHFDIRQTKTLRLLALGQPLLICRSLP